MKVWLVVLMLAVVPGCASSAPVAELAKAPLEANKGGILGLAIDDVYRPIPGATVYLEPTGDKAVTDALGQFRFVNLDPRTYTAKMVSEGHEAAPILVDVLAQEYSEMEVMAVRLSSDDSRILTFQFTLFTSCNVAAMYVAAKTECLPDFSDDAYPMGYEFSARHYPNATVLVSEVQMTDEDDYTLLMDCGPLRTDTPFREQTKVIWGRNVTHIPEAETWNNDCSVRYTVFFLGSASSVSRQLGFDQGAGVKLAMRATFMLSLFIGEPLEDVETYAILGS